MNHKIIYTSLTITLCITALGSLQAMANPENLPLSSYLQWLNKQPEMTRFLNLPGKQIDSSAIERYEVLASSPNYQSFIRYLETHETLQDNKPYLAKIYPSGTFLKRLSDLLVSYTDEVPEEVKIALQENEGRPEQIQAASEAFLKWYWSEDLNNDALRARLKATMDNKSKDIKLSTPSLYKAIEAEDAPQVVRYYNALMGHAALVAFQNYMATFRDDPINKALLDIDSEGNNALHYLAHKGSTKLAQELPQEVIDALINQKNQSGNTPLHTAIQAGNRSLP